MTIEEFEDTIEAALENLPQQFKAILKEKQIGVVAREKTPQAMMEKHPGRAIFGAFIGLPYGRFDLASMQTDPTRIELYKDSYEIMFKNEADIKNQIVKTLVHEIAHYFGFSEEHIRSLGY